MSTSTLKILMLEDVAEEAELIQRQLRKYPVPCEFKVVMTPEDYSRELVEFKPDVILSDNEMPQFSASEALEILKQHPLTIPFILVTGNVSEEFAANIIKAGADDYLLKDRLVRLPAAIEAALKAKKTEKEKLQSDRSLAQSERLFRTLTENSNLIISLLDENLKFIYRSPSGFTITGWTDDEIKQFDATKLIHPDDVGQAYIYYKECLANPGKPIKSLSRYLHKDGRYLWMEGTVTNWLHSESLKALVFNFQDVTDRVEAEEKLVQSEVRFRSLFEHSNEGVSLLDENSNVLYRSQGGIKVIGDSPRANSISFAHPDDREFFKTKFNEALSKPNEPVQYEVRFLHAAGNYFWAEGTFTNLLHVAGVNAVVANYRDVSTRKEFELKLIRASRLYLFISQVNKMIVRTGDEITLFTEACQIAVDTGKFKMAWIGLVDEVTKKVIPKVHAGVEHNYLDKINIISVGDEPEANGPIGRSIRSGTYIVCNDIENDPQMAPWKHAAKSQGYFSSIGLPIKKMGKVIGIFSLYAGETNFFDAEEINLLEEATADVSFALDVFEKEALRKKAEELVLESEQRYQTLTEVSPVGIFYADAAGSTTYVSPYWCKLSGMAFNEALGDGWLNAVNEEDRKRLKRDWKTAVAIQEISFSEYRFVHPDGSVTWVIGQATPERNSKKEIVGYIGTITDITAHKMAEISVLKEKQLTDTLINNLPGIFYLYDSAGNFIRWNKNFEEVTGFTNDEISQMHPLDFYDEDQKEKISSRIKSVLEKSAPGIEVEIHTKNKNKVPYYINSIAIEYEGKQCLLGMGLDLSARKKAENEIKKANERYELIGKATNDGVWDWNLETNEIWGNEVHQQLYGLTMAEAAPRFDEWEKRIHPDDREFTVKNFEAAITSDLTSFVEEYRFLSEKRGWINLLARTLIQRNEDGIAVRLIGSMMDITERKKAELLLLKNEKRFRKLVENGNDAFAILDTAGKPLYVSSSVERVLGYTEAEVCKMDMFSLVHPDNVKDVQETLSIVMQNPGIPVTGHISRLKHKDGTWHWFEDTITNLLDDEDINGIVDNFRDVTERVNQQNALAESEETFSKIFYLNPSVCAINDLDDDKFIDINEAFINYFGFTKAEVIGKTSAELGILLPDVRQGIIGDMDENGIVHSVETSVVTKSGEKKNILLSTSNIYLKDKEYAYTISIDITDRKKAEELVKASEEKYRTLVEQASDGIFIADNTGKFMVVNNSACKLSGYTPRELSELTIYNLVDPGSLVAQPFNFEGMLLPEGARSERKMIRKDGASLEVEISAKFLSDKRFIAFIRDITDRKKAEEEIKAANERFDMIAKATKDAVFEYDLITGESWHNESFLQLFNTDDADVKIKPDAEKWKAKIHPDDRERVMDKLREAYQGTADAWSDEFRFEKADSSYGIFYDRAKIVRDPAGKAIELVGSMVDITELKKAEESIQLSNERYNLVAKATNDSIWDLDLITGVITRTGDGFKIQFGYDEKEGFQNDDQFMQLVHPDDFAAVKASEVRAFSNPDEYFWEQEYRLLRANGQYANVYDKGYIIRDKNGKAVRMIGAIQDITKLKENELHLQELNEYLLKQAKELSDSNAELEQFAYVASHDLQEPLRMVTSFLTLLEKNYGPTFDANGKKYIHFAVDGAKRMRQIILDILEFSKVGSIDGSREEFSVQELVDEIKQLFRKQVEEKTAVIYGTKLPFVTANKAPIRQVFQNLIGNALKYTKAGTPPQIRITAMEAADHWQFAVSDNGIGIEKEYYDRIFVIFQRLHNQNDFSGTGIGLAITKKIIENLGGKIWLESEPGQGTTFYFTIKK